MYLPQLIPHILRVLTHDTSKDRQVTHKMLAALENFGPTLDDYIHLVLPPMVRLFDSADVPWSVRKASLDAIDHLSDSLDFSEYAGRIIHPLVRCIGRFFCGRMCQVLVWVLPQAVIGFSRYQNPLNVTELSRYLL
jgi:FKBP12-rapamycin complex-associated protein